MIKKLLLICAALLSGCNCGFYIQNTPISTTYYWRWQDKRGNDTTEVLPDGIVYIKRTEHFLDGSYQTITIYERAH